MSRLLGPPQSWQYFTFDDGTGNKRTWIIPLAQVVIDMYTKVLIFPKGSPVGPHPLDMQTQQAIMPMLDIDERHLDHIPAHKRNEPVILVQVDDPTQPHGYSNVLIDGSHRMALAVREGRTLSAYILSRAEASLCEVPTFDHEHFADLLKAIRGVPEALRKFV